MANKTLGLIPSFLEESMLEEQPEVKLDTKDQDKQRRLSKSKQWKEMVQYLRGRQAIYAKQIPGGAFYNNMSREDAGYYGGIGNCVIQEIDNWIAFMEAING